MKTIITLIFCWLSASCIYSQSVSQSVIATSGDYFENANGSVSLTLGELATETFSTGNVILTQGFQQALSITITGVNLDMLVYLEGPYEFTEMNSDLNTSGVIPLSQPYNIFPWNYPGTESVGSIPNTNVVDWILVELRETTGDASTAKPDSMIAQQAAFILKDGSIVDIDGENLLFFNNEISDNLYVVIYHRNHLAVLSAGPLTANNNNYAWDFTTSADQAYGTNAQSQIGGAYGMIGGDSDANGIIDIDDKNLIWATDVGNTGYFPSDMNMNSQVNNPDKNDIWYPNLDKESQLPDLCGGPITDIDGNTYNTVLIGTQCWMADNLKTTNYRNGTTISNVTSAYWSQLTYGAYVWWANDISFKDSYGALYNWFAIDDANGLCPSGWHVPTDDEWTALTDFIGGTSSPHANTLKSCRQINSPSGGYCNTAEHPRWNEDNTNHGTDDYGFSSLPGGIRDQGGMAFLGIGEDGHWWSSTENPPYHGWSRRMRYNNGIVDTYNSAKQYGYSVRCIKD